VRTAAIIAGAFLLLMSTSDYYLTYAGVQAGGVEWEANPYLRGAMREAGTLRALAWSSVHVWFTLLMLAFNDARPVGVSLALAFGVTHLAGVWSWLR